MSVYRGRPSISLTGSAVAGPFIARRPAVKPGHALVAVAIALACLALGTVLRENPGSAADSAAAGAPAHSYRQEGMLSLPAAAQAPVSAALGEDSPAYRVAPTAGGYRAHSPAQRLALRFTRSGVSVTSGHGSLGLALRAIGHGSRLRPVGASDPTAAANRVSYALGGGLREWYANGPLGLEQGFDLRQAPAGRGGPLTLSLAVSGNLRARLANGGLRLTGHGAELRYAGLVVRDARGLKLHAWLELRRQTLLIRIDDRDAGYPLHVDPWLENAELTPSDASANDRFGYSVAVSGNTVVVGEPSSDDGAGAVYVFTRRSTGWANATQTAKLTPSNPETGDAFGGQQLGFSVAIDGSTIVAGAPYWTQYSNSGNVEYQGAVYEWTLPKSGVWTNATQTAYLTATNLGQNDYLGASVAVQGSTIVAGAPNHLSETPLGGPGSVYVYTMPATGGWVNANQTAQLSGYDPDAGDGLGYSVAISGSTIVAGAPEEEWDGVGNYASRGGVYVWTEPPSGVWVNASATAELIPNDLNAGDNLGISVAVSGSTIVAGAPNHSIANRAGGTAYVWTLPPIGGWGNATQPAELTSTDLSGGLVGQSVAVSGNTVFSGGGYSITTDPGAVYEWTRPASGFWADETQVATLTPTDSAGADLFGDRMALSNSTLVIGAWGAGRAYVFGGDDVEISGETYEAPCSKTSCSTTVTPIPDVKVSVTSLDGGDVNTSDVSDNDGDWSVFVPPGGAYLVKPAGEDWEPQDQDLTVNADTPNIDFSQCEANDDDTAGEVASDEAPGTPTVWGRIASTQSTNPCQRKYTIRLGAWVPQQSFVDPYVGATNPDGTGDYVDAKHFYGDNYPPCLKPTVAKLYADTRPDLSWFSKFLGSGSPTAVSPGWGYVNVPINWNGITGEVSPGQMSIHAGKLVREYDYSVKLAGKTSNGSCPVPREMDPLVRVTVLSSSTTDTSSTGKFEIDMSWPIPFKPYEDLADIKDFNDSLLTPLTDAAKKEIETQLDKIPGYSGLSPKTKAKVKEYAIDAAKELGAKGAIELVEDALKNGAGYLTNLTPPPIKLGKKAIDILKKLAYGAADVRISGTFFTKDGIGNLLAGYTTLTLNTATDGFPSFYVQVTRPQGLVPWYSRGDTVTVTKTGYPDSYGNLPFVINDANTETGTTDQLKGGGIAKEKIIRNLSILGNGVPGAAKAFVPPIVVGTDNLAKSIQWYFPGQRS